MATITFGGGPCLDARKQFSNLKDGTQVPGYRGYIPHLKYAIGKTYGNDTHDLAQSYDFRHPLVPKEVKSAREPLQHSLPRATGDNKLTEKMVPGYTGYIPRRPFKYGDTYKVDCDYCIDEHMGNMHTRRNHEVDLVQNVRSYPTLRAISRDPQVKEHLNTYRDSHPQRPILAEDRRAQTEAPIPGYRGYVPKIGQTELGLGCRYATSTKQGFEAFYAQKGKLAQTAEQPISIERYPTEPLINVTGTVPYSKRVYVQTGMVPKYTGYVPQRRYAFGGTYGNTTRSLDVCNHGQQSFGDWVKTNPQATASFVC